MNACHREPLPTLFFGVIVFLISLSLSLPAQQPSPHQILKIETDMVTVEVTAIDKAGHYVRNLKPTDFRLYIDGQPQPIEHFSVMDEVTLTRPLAVVFALDLSGSLKPDEITTLRSAALKFTELMKGESVFAALSFNHEVEAKDATISLRANRTTFLAPPQ